MSAGRQAPPPGRGMKPMDYYKSLVGMGFTSWEAANAVQNNFGTPSEYAQQGKEKAGWAQLGGQLGGLGVAYGIGQIGTGAGAGSAGAAGAAGGAGTTAGSVMMPSQLGGQAALSGTGTTGLGSVASIALPVAAAVIAANNAWETGMKDIVKGKGTREDYINQGINMALGPVPNLAARMLGGRSIGSRMTSGKSNDQLLRDDFRSKLKTTGVADENYQVTLADGSKFNIGKDGKTKYTNVDGKTTRNAWDVDFNNPLAKFAVDQIDPMIRRIYGEEAVKAGIKPEQYTGMLVNAVTSNAKSKEDVIRNMGSVFGQSEFAKQAGITPPTNEPVRPEKGKVARLSPGLYRNDSGKIVKGKTMRDALEQAYGNTTEE